MSVLPYVGCYSDHVDVLTFVLSMRDHAISFMTYDIDARWLTSAGGWAQCSPYRGGKWAVWGVTCSDKIDSSYV